MKESVGVESEWCVCRNLIIGVSGGGGVSNCNSGLQVNHAGLYSGLLEYLPVPLLYA